jgi:ribonuclease R
MARRRVSTALHQSTPKQWRRQKRRLVKKHVFRGSKPLRTSRLEKDLLAFLHRQDHALSLQELMLGLELPRAMRRQLLDLLADLCRRQVLTCTPKRRYQLRGSANIFEGVVEMHPRGFGFAVLDNPPPGLRKQGEKNDPFISPRHLATASHGDRVLLEIISSDRKRAEARILEIIERAVTTLVGIFTAGRDVGLVRPEDGRYTYTISIQPRDFHGARNGEAVLVEIIDFAAGQHNPNGRIIKVLGDPEDIHVQAMMVAGKFGLPLEFSRQSLDEAARLSPAMPSEAMRQDLRHIPHVTIDGETARDFDDAVAIEQTGKGYRLYVSIADVSHYVRPGTPLDKEAHERGTSVYFPVMVLPMLPEKLSNDLCSLVPDADRPTLTAVLDFDRNGKRVAKTFCKSMIRSRHRLTYTLVKKILQGKDGGLKKRYRALLSPLRQMADLAAGLEKNRMERGSIGFSLPEAEVVLDKQDRITGIVRAERNVAHRLIEEFMLAANEAVAETLAQKGVPTLYRIHERPDAMKVAEFTRFAATLGLNLPDNGGSPRWFGQVLALVSDTPKEYIVNNLLLRTMQRARYSPENVGHFGLAADYYTHFTSPIRRYPDLMVHRALTALVSQAEPSKKTGKKGESQFLSTAGDFLSDRERNATEAEWEMIDRLKVRFMADKVGESFQGVISGVTDFGLYVELLDWFVNGAVTMADLNDDHYAYDDKNHRLIGRYTGNLYQIGDVVMVTVKSVEVQLRRINFIIKKTGRKK